MYLLLGLLVGRGGPLRILWSLARVCVRLLASVAWLVVAFHRPAAGVAWALAWSLAWLLWRLRARVWALVWRLFGYQLSLWIPRRVWMWNFQFLGWPTLVFRLGLTVKDPGGKAIRYPTSRWKLLDNGWLVLVSLRSGQQPAEFVKAGEAFAEAWGVHRVAVDSPKRGTVRMRAYIVDPLRRPLPAPPIPVVTDLHRALLGMREDGGLWEQRLIGRHLFIGAATGGGKGSVQWAVIRALCPMIRATAAEVWTFDPKFVEFARGKPLFKRYANNPVEMVLLMERAATLVATRAEGMAGHGRQHVPRPGDPYVLLNIDELAALTAYLAKDLQERFNVAMAIVLTQGRALGVSVMAAVQDPRKEIVPMRQLFTTRVVLRVDEEGQADLVLGAGATARGAAAHLIPSDETTGAGIGYVNSDDRSTPVRVRAGYTNDADIEGMCAVYAPPVSGAEDEEQGEEAA